MNFGVYPEEWQATGHTDTDYYTKEISISSQGGIT